MKKEDALRIAHDLKSIGYDLLPSDNPLRATYGICACKTLPDHTDENYESVVQLEWPMYNADTQVWVADVDARMLLDFMKQGGGSLCDNPKMLKMGYMKYSEENNVLTVMQTRIASCKQFSEEERESFNSIRNELKKIQESLFETRCEELKLQQS